MNQNIPVTPTLDTPHPSIDALLSKASSTCGELISLLTGENEALEQRQVAVVEENLKLKRKLAHRFERVMLDIKAQRDQLQTPNAKRATAALQGQIKDYDVLSRRNMLLLQSAYEARTGFLNTVRESIAAQQPNAGVYNQYGNTKPHRTPASIVNQSV